MNKVLLRWPIGRFKDIPLVMKPAFEHIEGALPSVKYLNGRFFKIIWIQIHPLWCPEEVRIPLDKDDALILTSDFGVEGELLGSLIERIKE